MCGCLGDRKCRRHARRVTETCDACDRGFIDVTRVVSGYAYRDSLPCGRCRGTGLVEVAA